MKLLLVDGHYYLYRSFYAIRGLRNSQGQPSNAIFAFAKALRKMLADLAPTHGAVLWDTGLPERRVALQPEYKQQRAEMPDDLRCQEQTVIDLCPLLGLRSIRVPATEADDLIAAYAKAAPSGCELYIATSDKDILQLAAPAVRIYSTSKADLTAAESGAGFVLLGPEEVAAKWGVPASAIADVLSLSGDASDNIPGVPGVGTKTAVGLIRQFGSVENLLARLGEVGNDKLRAKLADAAESIRNNREMVRLDDDLELPVPIQDLAVAADYSGLVDFFRHWEFRTLLAEATREAQAAGCLPPPAPQPRQGELF